MTHSQRNAGIIFFAVALLRLLFHWGTGFIADDAFITFRYAENIAAGLGFVYNAGERVLGTSTPLFTLVLSLFAVARVGVIHGALLISIVSSGLTAALLYRYAERLRFGSLWVVPIVLYGLWPRAMISETCGMETALFTMLTVAALYFARARQPYYALAAATLAAATRPEGMLALVLILAASLRAQRERWFSFLAVPCALLAPWILFATWYFGSPVPNTVPAKLALYSQTGAGSIWERADYLFGFGQGYGWALAVLFAGGAVWLWKRQRSGTLESLWVMGMIAFYVFGGTKMFFWYVTPIHAMMLLIGSASVPALVEKIERLRTRALLTALSISAALIVALGAANLARIDTYRLEQERLTQTHAAIGYYLRTHTAEDALVAAEDIGYIGYTSGRRILDRDGLVSPEAVAYNRRSAYDQLIYDQAPRVVVASTRSPISGFIDSARFGALYIMAQEFPFDRFTSYRVYLRREDAPVEGG